MTQPHEALIAELLTLCDKSLVIGIPDTARQAMLRAAEALSRPLPNREGMVGRGSQALCDRILRMLPESLPRQDQWG